MEPVLCHWANSASDAVTSKYTSLTAIAGRYSTILGTPHGARAGAGIALAVLTVRLHFCDQFHPLSLPRSSCSARPSHGLSSPLLICHITEESAVDWTLNWQELRQSSGASTCAPFPTTVSSSNHILLHNHQLRKSFSAQTSADIFSFFFFFCLTILFVRVRVRHHVKLDNY